MSFKIMRFCKVGKENCPEQDLQGNCLEVGKPISDLTKCPLLVGRAEKGKYIFDKERPA